MTHADEPGTEDHADSVIQMLIDSARAERGPLLTALHRAADGGPIDGVAALAAGPDPDEMSAASVVAESVVTLLLTTGDDRAQQAQYLALADRLRERDLFDAKHFNAVLMLLLLERGNETGALPSDTYLDVAQYVTDHHPEWQPHLDGVEPEWAAQLN